ncbi:LysM peptidoglycan-binding domain-containing protein [Dellaglioa algida]|uniref:LysM peptidoglycan-binding domain-containing protein n=1 Tax=Dellaglioa algida TaxID=105612 RepID=UPI000BCB5AF7|nr:LysM peptidoglycan-binding domain-containing protein [Dellaglioa algida]MDK1729461.1 LysM peptidoglycan-binding domain-containing protein [Dellaglioa algida]MDK1741895.1 LysM peptidoglycan-binding domain-containing protein [Dellaglioa algida]SOB50361.1 putative LysM domain-containing protein [Dellaglioa algida]
MKLRTKVIVSIVVVVCVGGGTILASTKSGRDMVEWVASRGQVGSESQQKKEYAEQQKLAEAKYGEDKKSSSSESKKEKPKKKKAESKESKKSSTKTSSSSSSSDIDTDTITVVYGDSLSSIAANHGMSVKSLVSLNDMENTTLRPGQVLKVVAGSGRAYASSSSSDTTSSDNTTSSDTNTETETETETYSNTRSDNTTTSSDSNSTSDTSSSSSDTTTDNQ